MATDHSQIRKPQRWDVPFGDQMTDQDVDQLLRIAPFCEMEPKRFPSVLPLEGILRNDTRRVHYQPGDIVLREGDYGSSAMLILSGSVMVSLQRLPDAILGRGVPQRHGWWKTIAQLWTNHSAPEVRPQLAEDQNGAGSVGTRQDAHGTRVFLQDIPRQLNQDNTVTLTAGEIFGELAAVARTPRTATVVAAEPTEVLEIRWQGLRDLQRFDSALRQHIDRLYRENSLRVHLRETSLFAGLPEEAVQLIAEQTVFETYGDFDWHHEFQNLSQRDRAQRIEAEPVIANEGDHPDSLILIRSGFARVSQRYGQGHRTLAYLGKGQVFGIDELAQCGRHDQTVRLNCSLRAVGYVDILRIPADLIHQWVVPALDQPLRPSLWSSPDPGARKRESTDALDTGLLEFLVEQRLMNATQAMVIDLDRCTRCDDCVRACAAAHDNNPRFLRQGPVYDHYQFASACMQCVDPVCMIGCPTGAIARDRESGTVMINDRTCIGCATCAESCPYDNIRMVEIRDQRGQRIKDTHSQLPILKATKCDMCNQQRSSPACQLNCPHDALIRIDMSDQETLAQWMQLDRS